MSDVLSSNERLLRDAFNQLGWFITQEERARRAQEAGHTEINPPLTIEYVIECATVAKALHAYFKTPRLQSEPSDSLSNVQLANEAANKHYPAEFGESSNIIDARNEYRLGYLDALDASRRAVPPEDPRLTDTQCDAIIAALENIDWEGFTRADIRDLYCTINAHRAAETKDAVASAPRCESCGRNQSDGPAHWPTCTAAETNGAQ